MTTGSQYTAVVLGLAGEGYLRETILVPGVFDEDAKVEQLGGCPGCGEQGAVAVELTTRRGSRAYDVTCEVCGTKLAFVPPLVWRTDPVVDGEERLVGERIDLEECRECAAANRGDE